MDEQLKSIKKLFEEFNDEDLLTRKVMLPSQEKLPLGEALIKPTVKHLAAYKMHLFLFENVGS